MLSSFSAQSQCTYTLELSDSWGDGWNGGQQVEATAGSVVDTFTLASGFFASYNLQVNTNDTIILNLIGGPYSSGFPDWNSEVSFELKDPLGVVVYSSGFDPSTGVLYSNSANCPPCGTGTIDSALIVNSNTIDLYFTESLGTLVNIEYGQSGFQLGLGNRIDNYNAANDSVRITNLFAGLQYDFYIQDSCISNGQGAWVGPFQFTITTGGTPTGFVQNFDAFGLYLPSANWLDGWSNIPTNTGYTSRTWVTEINQPSSGTSTGPAADHTTGIPSAGTYVYWESSFGSATSGQLISPYVDLVNATSKDFSFWYHMNGSTMGDMYINVDTGTGLIPIDTLFGATESANFSGSTAPWLQKTYNLTNYASTFLRVVFVANQGSSFYGDMAVDDVALGSLPACSSPMVTANATLTSVDFSWNNATGGSDSVFVEFGPVGFALGTGTLVSFDSLTSPYTVSNLTTDEKYDFLYWKKCGSTLTPISQVNSFNTLIGANCGTADVISSLPYNKDSLTTDGKGDDFDNTDACNSFYMNGDDYIFVYNATSTNLAEVVLTNTGTWVGVFVTDACPDDPNATCVAQATLSGGNPTIPQVLFEAGKTYYITVSTNPAPQFTPFDIAINVLPNEVSINSIDNPVNPVSAGFASVEVNISNNGGSSINSVSFGYTKNGVSQAPVTVALNNLLPGDDTTVTIGGTNFPTTPTDITAYITGVMGSLDNNQSNDTVSARFCGPISGTFTVGGAGATFATISDAVAALDCGINGPVVFNINPGTYNEAISIPEVVGASATNTITFDGGSAATTTITWNSNVDVPTVELNGADYVTIKNMTIEAAWTSTDNWCVFLTNDANWNTIENCELIMPQSTSSDRACINVSNARFAAANSSSAGGNNANHLTIKNNVMRGGYYGVSMRGTSTTTRSADFTIENNDIEAYYYGVYSYYMDSIDFKSNTVINHNAPTTHYSFYGAYGVGHVFEANSLTSPDRGFYFFNSSSTPNADFRFVNNMVSANTDYGIYMSTIKNATFLHNSFLGEPAFYITNGNTNGLNVQNNIFASQNDYAFESNSADSASFSNLDYNLYFSQASPALEMGNTSYGSLLAWQNAKPSFNANSLEGDPLFNSNTDLHITLGLLADSAGTPVGIITDIDGDGRYFLAPDMGADEYTPITSDLELLSDVSFNTCKNGSDSITFYVVNQAQSPIDFSNDNFTLNVDVTGAANSTASVAVNSGVANPGDTISLTASPIVLNIDGSYNIDAYLSSTWDIINENDSLFGGTYDEVFPITLSPDTVVQIANATQTVDLKASSIFSAPAMFNITERCNWASASTGAAVGGKPSWMAADDYVEISGSPNSDISGYTYELWTFTAIRISYTFPQGSVLSPNGTLILGTYLGGTASPANFYYVSTTQSSTSSSTANGNILKDPNGNIIDAVAYNSYSFPAASGVTSADWSGNLPGGGSTWGIRLQGPDLNGPTGWSVSSNTNRQDPNAYNTGFPAISVASSYPVSWSLNSVVIDTVNDITVGPYTVADNGLKAYVFELNGPCGAVYDTAFVNVAIIPDEVAVNQILGADGGCAVDTAYYAAEICNNGANGYQNLPVFANLDGFIFSDTLDTLAPYTCDTVMFSTAISILKADSTFNSFSVYVNVIGDVDNTNDTSGVGPIVYTSAPVPPTATNDTSCDGNAALTAQGLETILWYDSISGGNIVGIGDTLNLTGLTANDTVYAQVVGFQSQSLLVSYAAGNSQAGNAFKFNINTVMQIDGFDINSQNAVGTPVTIDVWYRVGDYAGAVTSTAGWTQVASGATGISGGTGSPTTINLPTALQLTPGDYSFMIYQTSGNVNYTNGSSVGAFWAGDQYMTVYQGHGISFPLGSSFSPRNFNGSIHYSIPSPSCFNPNRTMAVAYYNGFSVDSVNSTAQSSCQVIDGTISVFATDTNTSIGSGFQYSIDGGATFSSTSVFTGLAQNANGYNVVVTDGYCTENAGNVAITKPGAPAAPVMPANATYCEGDTLMPLFVDTANYASAATIIRWYNSPNISALNQIGQDTLMPIDTIGTITYYATQVDSGCEGAVASVDVSINAAPVAPILDGDTTLCFGQPIVISGNIPGFVPPSLTCTESGSASGTDASGVTVAINSFPCVIGNVVSATLDATIGTFCTSWYGYNIFVDGIQVASNQCNQTGFDLTPYIPFTSVSIVSQDNDNYSDFITLSLSVNLTYLDLANFNWYSDAGLTNSIGMGNTLAAKDTVGTVSYYATYSGNSGCESLADSVKVTKLVAPAAPTVASQVYCDGDSITPLTITGSGGTYNVYGDMMLNNQITTGVTGYTTTLTGPGYADYYVTEVNATGCESPAGMASVTINAVPSSANLGADKNYCQGDSILPLSAGNIPGTTLNWYSDAAGTTLLGSGSYQPANTVGTTTYYASLTNGLCSGPIDSVQVTINAIPGTPTAAGGATYCDGDALAALTATGSSASFSWYTDAALTNMVGSGASFTPANIIDTVTYYLTQDANGCKSTGADSATVIIHGNPSINLVLSDSASACNTSDGWIEISATGGDGVYSYSVNGGTTTSANDSITGLAPGNYTPFVVDGNGCSDQGAVVTINAPGQPFQPSVVAGNNAVYCSGEMFTALEVVDTISGQVFNWYYDAALTNLYMSGDSVMPADSVGTITYYVTANASGCQGPSATATVTVNSIPAAPTAGSDLTYCLGNPVGNVSATANSSGALRWYTDNNLTSLIGTGNSVAAGSVAILPGTYSFYVTETTSGCESTYDSVNVTINAIPNIPNAGMDMVYCDGDMLMPLVGSGSAGTLNWYSNAQLTNNVGSGDTLTLGTLPIGTTNYWLAETNGFGCQGNSDKVSVTVHPTPMAPMIVNAMDYCDYDMVDTLMASGNGGTYTWYNNYTTALTGMSVVPPSAVGAYSYMLTETNQFGCESDSGMATVNVFESPSLDSLTIVDVTGGCADSTGSVTLFASGGDNSYTYFGNIFGVPTSNGNNSTFGNLPAGTYDSLYVMDGNGCVSGTDLASVAAPGQPSLLEMVSTNATYCFGDPIADLVAQDTSVSTAGVIEWYSDAALTNLLGTGDSITAITSVGVRTYYAIENNVGCKGPATSVMVTVNALPATPTASANAQYCDGASVNDVTVSGAGGTFTWYSDAALTTMFATGDTVSPSITAPGVETLYVVETNTNNCTSASADNVTITIDTLPNVMVAALADICENGGTVQLTGGMPMGGTWSADSGLTSGGVIDPVAIGGANTYNVVYTYTDGNGCTEDDTTSITINPEPVVTFAAISSLCINGGSFAVTGGSPAGGMYVGTGVDSTGNFDPTVAGSGTTTITYNYTDANNCSSSNTSSVTVFALPNAAAGVDQTICFGDSVTLTATGGTTYSWSNGAGNATQSVSPAATTNYGVLVTDVNGCTNTDSVMVNVNQLPAVSIGSINSVCDGAAPVALLTGTPANGTYSGTGVGGGVFNPSVGAGSYVITYTFTDGNNCTNSANTTMIVDTLPTVTFATPANICDGSAATNLTGGAPAGGAYSGTGVTGGQFDPLAAGGAGTYNLSYSFTDGNGCSNSVTSTITVDTLPTITWTPFNDICDNASAITLSEATPAGGSYSGTGVAGGQFDPLAAGGAGNYSISYSFTDGNGCSSNDAQSITVNPSPVVDLGGDTTLCNNIPTVTLDAGSGASYVWSLDGLTLSNTTQTISVDGSTGSGTYTVVVTNAFGCEGQDEVVVNYNEICASVNTTFADNVSVTYYPNPTTGMLNVDITGLVGEDITLTVTNMHGQQVFNTFIENAPSNLRDVIDISTEASGVYFIKLTSGDKSFVERISLR